MRSRGNVTKTLLEFSSVWHGVCIYWNENIHSVKPCVTPVLHPPPLSSPSPAPRGGAPSNTGAQLRMGIFTPKTEKRRGALFKNGKTQEGVPLLEGGLPGNFEEREKRRLEPLKNGGKRREGVPFRKGVYGGNLE